MNGIEPPTGHAAGYCHRCERWTPEGRIIAEVHGDSGGGGTVVRCPACDLDPSPRRVRASDPRRYPG